MVFITLGSAPADESCAQVGSADYETRAHAECQEWRRQLVRFYESRGKQAPPDFRLVIKANPHDFGTYYEVNAKFSEDDEKSSEFAYWLEAHAPTEWDTEARTALPSPLWPF